jgi:hypothetical protein
MRLVPGAESQLQWAVVLGVVSFMYSRHPPCGPG